MKSIMEMRTTSRVPRRLEPLQKKLLKERDKLVGRVGDFRSAIPGMCGPADMADFANAFLEQETASALNSVAARMVLQIDNALYKMEHGQYGTCETCGEPIPLARLRILPFTSLCFDCKQREEADHAAARLAAGRWAHLSGDREESEEMPEPGDFIPPEILELNTPGAMEHETADA